MKKVEIYILSGFLGAGKTTLLQNILTEEQKLNRKVAVVMNEMGSVSIDSDAVPNHIPLKELLNGCVCCTLSDKLEGQLSDLVHQYMVDVVYIETTGAAHPIEVLDACLSPLLADKILIKAITTLVDASRWHDRQSLRIPLQKLMTEQVKHADTILLNKTDTIHRLEHEVIIKELQSLNPTARILSTTFAEINMDVLLHANRNARTNHVKVHALDHLHIKAYVHTFSNPINKELFEEFLRTMPDSIYRIKGYIRYACSIETILFQYAYGLPVQTNSGLNIKNTLVFIGNDLDHGYLKNALSQLEVS